MLGCRRALITLGLPAAAVGWLPMNSSPGNKEEEGRKEGLLWRTKVYDKIFVSSVVIARLL